MKSKLEVNSNSGGGADGGSGSFSIGDGVSIYILEVSYVIFCKKIINIIKTEIKLTMTSR